LQGLSLTFFFFNRQNIINQQARARCTNKLGWKKKQIQGEIGCHNNTGSTKPLKNHPQNDAAYIRNINEKTTKARLIMRPKYTQRPRRQVHTLSLACQIFVRPKSDLRPVINLLFRPESDFMKA